MKNTIKNYSNEKCPDSIFGQIKYEKGIWCWKCLNIIRKDLLSKNGNNLKIDFFIKLPVRKKIKKELRLF